MLFGSDNHSGVADEISACLQKHSKGMAIAYGDSDLDKSIEARFNEIFETQTAVYFVGTGTAANSLAIAATMKPGGVVFCHNEAHVVANEGGAPEFLSGGGRLALIGGKNGKIDPAQLDYKAKTVPDTFNHFGQGTMVTLTQATETGSIYTLDEINTIASIAKQHHMAVHMDGARFANALTALNCTPAQMTWQQGVDMVSFGGTKNGCWCAEALIVFNRDLLSHFQFIRKRSGHLFSKTRFISAQFEAYLENDLWLKLARHSNTMGTKLEAVVSNAKQLKLAWKTQSNQVFFIADKQYADELLKKGAVFIGFPPPKGMEDQIGDNEELYRLVTSFSTTQADVDDFAGILDKHSPTKEKGVLDELERLREK